jgi:glycosyltransferase involved in cell wall biosynthesis
LSRAQSEGSSHPVPVRPLSALADPSLPAPDVVYERYSLGHTDGLDYARRVGRTFILEVNAPLVQEAAAHRSHEITAEMVAAERRLFDEADVVLAVSQPMAGYVRNHRSGSGGVHVVPNGAEPAEFLAPRPSARPVLVFLGHPKPWHGADRLPSLAHRLATDWPDLTVRIIGGGPGANDVLTAAGRLRADHLFDVTGPIAPSEVGPLLADGWLGIAPYPSNDFFYFSPLKIVEYLMAGLPIVSTDVGDIRATVGNAGIVTKPDDDDDLERATRRLLSSPSLRERMSRDGLTRARRHHTWDEVAATIESIGTKGAAA